MYEYISCKYCKYGIYVPINRQVMCKKEGMVSPNFSCKKFVFDPFKMKIRRVRNVDFTKYNNEDFSIE